MKNSWLFWILFAGVALLYEFVPAYRLETALRGNGATTSVGIVEQQRSFTRRSTDGGVPDPTFVVHYHFQVAGDTIRSRYACQCSELAHFRAGDAISIRYVRANPETNRPAAVHYNATWLLIGTVVGSGLVVGALLGFLFKTAEDSGASVEGSLQGSVARPTPGRQPDVPGEQALSYASNPAEDEIVRQFQRRRWWTNVVVWPSVVLGFVLIYLGFKPLNSMPLSFVGFFFVFVAAVALPLLMRCPNCNLNPMSQISGGSRGVLIDPTRCPNCGVRLK